MMTMRYDTTYRYRHTVYLRYIDPALRSSPALSALPGPLVRPHLDSISPSLLIFVNLSQDNYTLLKHLSATRISDTDVGLQRPPFKIIFFRNICRSVCCLHYLLFPFLRDTAVNYLSEITVHYGLVRLHAQKVPVIFPNYQSLISAGLSVLYAQVLAVCSETSLRCIFRTGHNGIFYLSPLLRPAPLGEA